MTATYVTLGVGVVLLAVFLLAALRPVRRFGRARTALRADVRGGTAALRELRRARRG